MSKIYSVYILSNWNGNVLYTGITSSLQHRCRLHKEKAHRRSFAARYNVTKLVYYESFDDPRSAIQREKEIKGWVRAKKIKLIEATNPKWKDLYDSLPPQM